jgi:hypothetical protein
MIASSGDLNKKLNNIRFIFWCFLLKECVHQVNSKLASSGEKGRHQAKKDPVPTPIISGRRKTDPGF